MQHRATMDLRPERDGIFGRPVSPSEIALWRDMYRQEMNCQIVHDSMHSREGWTQPYVLEAGGVSAGYGSILIGGPWTGREPYSSST